LVVVRNIETASHFVDEVAKLLSRFILFFKAQFVLGHLLSFLDDSFYLLVFIMNLRLILLNVLIQIIQTFVDEPKIPLALAQG